MIRVRFIPTMILLALDMVLAFPAWLLTMYMTRFMPATHPWRKREKFFSLLDWTVHRTSLVIWLDFQCWLGIAVVVGMIAGICMRS